MAAILDLVRARGGLLAVFILAALVAGCGHATAITRTQDGVTTDADVPIHVGAAAVKPAVLHLFQGHVVTFVNDDRVPRTVGADAVKSDVAGCAAIILSAQFNDEQRPADTAFQGVVVTHDR